MIGRNFHISGCMTSTMEDANKALDYAKHSALKQICEVRPLSQLPESFEQLRKGQVAGRIVIDFNLD